MSAILGRGFCRTCASAKLAHSWWVFVEICRVEALSQELFGLLCKLDMAAAHFFEELCELFVACGFCVLHVASARLGALERVVDDCDQIVVVVELACDPCGLT